VVGMARHRFYTTPRPAEIEHCLQQTVEALLFVREHVRLVPANDTDGSGA
jgi:hypothetical protein